MVAHVLRVCDRNAECRSSSSSHVLVVFRPEIEDCLPCCGIVDSSVEVREEGLSEDDIKAVANGVMWGYKDVVLEGVATDLKGD